MDFDNSAQVDALAKLPPEPPKPAERSAWGWVPRIVQSAAAGVAGSVADVVKGAAAADALTLGADPRARGAFTEQQLREGQSEGQRQIDTGEAMTSTLGDSFRQVQRDARPDPVTAGTAERLVFGVAEPLLKLIGAGVTMGPIGLAGASAEIGFQQSDDLRQQGVDIGTRTAVGALTAGVTAASVALPLVGSTLKSTAALYLAGGPGGFVAQQAATRAILEHADYSAIGAQFDPFDPVGLAMSALIPLPFAAHGAMRIRKASSVDTSAGRVKESGADATGKPEVAPVPAPMSTSADTIVKPKTDIPKVSPEAVDAAMVHNLTLLRDAADFEQPRPDIRPTVAQEGTWLSAKIEGGEVSGRIHDDGLHIKFAEVSPEKQGGGVGVALYKALVDDAHAKGLRVFSEITVETSAVRVYEALERRGYVVERLPGGGELPVSKESPEGALFGRGANSPVFEVKPPPRPVDPAPGAPDPVLGVVHAVGGRDPHTVTFSRRESDGQMTRVIEYPDGHRTDEFLVTDKNGDEHWVSSDGYSKGEFFPVKTSPESAAARAKEELPTTPPTPATLAPPDFGPLTAAVTQARDLIKTHGKAIDQYLATNEVPPEVNNLLIGLSEAGKDPRRVAAFLDLVAKQDKAKGPADATADAVEGMRTLTDEQLTGTEPDALKPAIDPLMQSISDRVAAVHLAAPDMVVGLDASGNPITVADEIARIRREAAEGTDTDLGAADAQLVNVAANCALSLGA